MRQITDVAELRELQMQVLDAIDAYCHDNNLTYFISSGTLLGAVRHGGYIPWDDDIDIYMPRESYERIRRGFNDANGRYKLIDGYNTPGYHYTFTKIVDTETILIEGEHPDRQIGIYVDIFPIDYVPEDYAQLEAIFKKKQRLDHLLIARQCPILCTKSIGGILYRLYSRLTTTRLGLLRKYDSLIKNDRQSSLVCNMTDAGPKSPKSAFRAEAIASDVDIKFENRSYKTMVGYMEYLEHTYGDYMTLPPVDKRVHHSFTAYIKNER